MTSAQTPAAGGLASRHAARLLPRMRAGGPIPWVIAILIALVVIAAAGGLALSNLADTARADLSGALTVQIIEAEPERRKQLAQQAADLLADQALVTSVRIVPEAELAGLLEPWLGAGVTSEDVPIPALIDVELSRRASANEIAALRAALDTRVDNARIDAQSEWLRPVYDALAALQYLAIALIVLVAIATAGAVWLAARNVFATHRGTVEIIHLLGGTDAQITRVFQRTVAIEAGIGAGVGVVAGGVIVWLLGQQFAALDSGMIGGAGLAIEDWLILVSIPIAGVLLAVLTARLTISLALRAML